MKKEIEEANDQIKYNRSLKRFDQAKFEKHVDECAYDSSFLNKQECSCPDEAKRLQAIQNWQIVGGMVAFLLFLTMPIWMMFLK